MYYRVALSCLIFMMTSQASWAADRLDPLEGYNRKMFVFNKKVDEAIIKPVAQIYRKLPNVLQTGVGNFFDNFREVTNFANDTLQFKINFAVIDVSRFAINTTFGLLGLLDPATDLGLEKRKQDFGQTLYHWGFKNSPYFIIPILGPSTIRDAIGLTVDRMALSLWPWINSTPWYYGLSTLDFIDLRARLLGHEDVIDTISVDEYVFVRDAYFQHREFLFSGKDNNTDALDMNQDEVNPYAEFAPDSTESAAASKESKEVKKPFVKLEEVKPL